MEILLLVIGLTVGLVIGYLVAAIRSKAAGAGAADLAPQLVAAEARAALLQEQLKQRDAANDRENKILQTLSPVQKQLEAMKLKVDQIETQRAAQAARLEKGIEDQVLAANQLRNQTHALAKAMSSSSTRGQWGEVQLERIVELAGLVNRVDYITQGVTTNEAGQGIKPDMVIQLPGKRAIPVDSKVPFTAYLQAMELDDTTSPEQISERKRLLTKHVSDLRGHISELGKKRYWEGYANAADYVVAFIPSENLLAAAMHEDPTLGEYAMSQKVALATPQTLFSLMKTVALIWQNTTDQEALNGVIQLGKDIFARLAVVAKHADNVGKGLASASSAYNEFVSSLERNLLTTARSLNAKEVSQFGATEIKELITLDSSMKPFTKPELAQGDPEIQQETVENTEG